LLSANQNQNSDEACLPRRRLLPDRHRAPDALPALADALKSRGALTHFLCRYLPDHLAGLLEQNGYPLTRLPGDRRTDATDDLAHSQWLGTSLVALTGKPHSVNF